MSRPAPRRRWFIPEVIQTSAMDCGPAVLTALLGGHGIHVDYGRLREACQVGLDGTAIGTLEELAVRFGLDAEQVIVPVDHVFLPEARCLPAIVGVRLPSGFTHYVVLWRRVGDRVQVLDPASGRHWWSVRRVEELLYRLQQPVDAADWAAWAATEDFCAPLRARLRGLGIRASGYRASGNQASGVLDAWMSGGTWQESAGLDDAVRTVARLVAAGVIRRGDAAARAVDALRGLPPEAWTAPVVKEEAPGTLCFTGAILIRVRGRRDTAEPLGPVLAAMRDAPRPRPWAVLWNLLRAEHPLPILGTLLVAAVGTVAEAVLLRALVPVVGELGLLSDRGVAVGLFVVFGVLLLGIEAPLTAALLRAGRVLETRFRVALFERLPRLGDRYFASRPISDLAARAHQIHMLRGLPGIAGRLARTLAELVCVAAGLIWLHPVNAPITLLAVIVAVGVPAAAWPVLAERDLRARSHAGALGRYTLDALLGLLPARAQGGEATLVAEHESLLGEWRAAARDLLQTTVVVDAVVAVTGVVTAIVLVAATAGGDPAGLLLQLYWALALPVLGERLAATTRQLPAVRNTALRLLEPLTTPVEGGDDTKVEGPGGALRGGSAPPPQEFPSLREEKTGMAIRLDGVTVTVGGHVVLEDVDLDLPAGTHAAIIGPSGAGKSSLISLLLGLHTAAAGEVRVDGAPLDIEALRRDCVWLDPAVQLWSAPMLENLRYGHTGAEPDWDEVLDAAQLHGVVAGLPEGLATPLGAGGGRLSGGEGQRVRLGRGVARRSPRLVLLDEPFRGLDRATRRGLLARLRARWPAATLLCVTHDVVDTRDFPRVLVVEEGRVVEDHAGPPAAGSLYARLLDEAERADAEVWADWRKVRVEGGRVVEAGEHRAGEHRTSERSAMEVGHGG